MPHASPGKPGAALHRYVQGGRVCKGSERTGEEDAQRGHRGFLRVL